MSYTLRLTEAFEILVHLVHAKLPEIRLERNLGVVILAFRRRQSWPCPLVLMLLRHVCLYFFF